MKAVSARLLNGITMYRLMLYYLGALLVTGFGLSLLHQVFVAPLALCTSLVVLIVSCWASNRMISWLTRVPTNRESAIITALILALIMPPAPPTDVVGILALVFAAVVAIASKFLITIGHKHIFNPVAIGAVASGVVMGHPAIWWVAGNPVLLAVVILGGLAVTKKVQRFDMIAAYLIANVVAVLVATPPAMLGMALRQGLIYSPLFFAGFAMLTEPMTAAHGKYSRLVYGAIVGLLSAPGIHIGSVFFSPQLAFLVANLYAFAASPKGRFRMTLLKIERVASDCYEFVFSPDRPLRFRAGQYLDWTLHVPAADSRGNRRPFTIASAPSEDSVRLGVKFYEQPSAFKRQLLSLSPGDVVFGSQIAGTFTLPPDPASKILFIAGGIGITPFRSMLRDLINRNEARDIVLIYGNRRAGDIAYSDLLDLAEREIGLRVIHVISDDPPDAHDHVPGFIDAELIRRSVPDLDERVVYLSGPQVMVARLRGLLRHSGVPRRNIRTDYFPGF